MGLKINKIMRIGSTNTSSLILNNEAIVDVESVCFLGNILSKDVDSEDYLNNRINKAIVTFYILYKVWRFSHISIKTKMCIFNCSVISILLYYLEDNNTSSKVQTASFHVNWRGFVGALCSPKQTFY